jgi:hypothetical protein
MPPLENGTGPLKTGLWGRRRLDEKFNPEAETFRQDGESYKGRPLVSEKVRASIEGAMM